MQYILNGKTYHMASELNDFQMRLYVHLIDWKHENLNVTAPGYHGGHRYDYLFPDEYIVMHPIPPFIHSSLHEKIKDMQNSEFAYKIHKMAYHMASSQTACINLFMPILLNENADTIIRDIPGCPEDFVKIDKQKLYEGFCFEYWGQDIMKGKGVLGDHSNAAGTDSDLAIAYINNKGKHCLWLIEHKLTEQEFTTCGGYRSKGNKKKDLCRTKGLGEILDNTDNCHYARIKFKYWDVMKQHKGAFKTGSDSHWCPFCGGMNQLWRNQLLAFAYMDSGKYDHVSFSVVHHKENKSLTRTMEEYRELISHEITMTSFTNEDAISAYEKHARPASDWAQWYRNLYLL